MKQKTRSASVLFALLLVVSTGLALVPQQQASALTRNIIFPIIGHATFVNDYYYSRSGGQIHGATDIMANKGQALVSAVNGTIINVNYPMPSWGWSITIRDDAGYDYTYIHMNDDTPGTNDGRGGPMNAYGADMQEGNRVVRGQFLGWNGDSGKSNGVAHLHFEMEKNGQRINPYDSLRAATRIARPVVHPKMPNEVMPFRAESKVMTSVAMGNFDGDAAHELVVSVAAGGPPKVNIYDDNDALMHSYFAYDPNFYGGVNVGTADVDGDGTEEVITAAGRGGGPHVKVFEPNGTLVSEFMAYDSRFSGGVFVDGGDVDNDGNDEIITGPGAGGGPHIKAVEGNGTVVTEFMAFGSPWNGGVDVAGGNVTGNAADEIIVSAGPGGGPHVVVYAGSGAYISNFLANRSENTAGVRISVSDIDTNTPEHEILTVPAVGSIPRSKTFQFDGVQLDEELFLEEWWIGWYDVAAGFGTSKGSTGVNRRASVRDAVQD